MDEHGLDALVVRAPDNVLYLTNFWGMKGYDACVFPREGEPVLVCLEASADDAARPGGGGGGGGVLEAARAGAAGCERVGLELTLGTQAADRMVGEPTTFTADWFGAFGDVAD